MGWSYPYSTHTRADLVQYLRRPDRFGERFELVRACATGSRHWYLVRERATGRHWIGLDLMKGIKGDGWGYKDLDETCGPCDVDCPLSYLAAPHEVEPRGYAAQWRERVRAYHAARRVHRARFALVPGVWVTYAGRVYQLSAPAGPRRGWHVVDVFGQRYRMQARQLAHAQPAPGHEPAPVDRSDAVPA